eukprot:3179042-Pleurochrysis_carterae.AAC.1
MRGGGRIGGGRESGGGCWGAGGSGRYRGGAREEGAAGSATIRGIEGGSQGMNSEREVGVAVRAGSRSE